MSRHKNTHKNTQQNTRSKTSLRGKNKKLPQPPANRAPATSESSAVPQQAVLAAQQELLCRLGASAVLVDAQYRPVHYLGETDRYLTQSEDGSRKELPALVHHGLQTRLRRALRETAARGQPVTSDCRVKRHSRYRPVRIVVTPVKAASREHPLLLVAFEDGNERIGKYTPTAVSPGQHLPILRDITDRKAAEASLRASEERYRTLVETSPDAITLMDADGTILTCNQQGLAMRGCQEFREVVGKSLLHFVAPEDSTRARENLRRALRAGTPLAAEYTWISKDGTRMPVE